MAVRDIVSKLKCTQVFNAAISTDTATTGSIIDTADFECGLAFFVGATAYTDGEYVLSLQEGLDSGLSDAAAVSADKLIGTAPTVDEALASNAGVYLKLGAHSTLRYVRPVLTSTSTTTGATLQVLAVEEGEFQPVT